MKYAPECSSFIHVFISVLHFLRKHEESTGLGSESMRYIMRKREGRREEREGEKKGRAMREGETILFSRYFKHRILITPSVSL